MYCRLLEKEIDDGECYDIQMVRNKYILPEVLAFTVDYEKAEAVCAQCKYNQLP